MLKKLKLDYIQLHSRKDQWWLALKNLLKEYYHLPGCDAV
jgi:hypothetical protein